MESLKPDSEPVVPAHDIELLLHIRDRAIAGARVRLEVDVKGELVAYEEVRHRARAFRRTKAS